MKIIHIADTHLGVAAFSRVDPETGMTVPLARLDQQVRCFLDQHLDGKRLDREVPGLVGNPATSENILSFIHDGLQEQLGDALWKLKLKETNNNFFEIGEEMQ